MFPRPTDERYNSMLQDIKKNGQLVPIYHKKDGTVLDGYTKWDISKELKIKPITELKDFKTKEQDVDFIISMNLQRRQLSIGQQFLAYYDYYLELKTIRKQHHGKGYEKLPESGVVLAEKIGCKRKTVERCVYILKYGNKNDIENMRNDIVAIASIESRIRSTKKDKEEMEFLEQSETAKVEKIIKIPINPIIKEKEKFTITEVKSDGSKGNSEIVELNEEQIVEEKSALGFPMSARNGSAAC